MGCKCSIFKRHTSIEDVTLELRHKGIDDIILTLGIDYTKSNRFNGKVSNNNKSLHHIEDVGLNPYQQILSLVTKTLEPMLPYNSIYMLGFSDVYAQDNSVFPLHYRNNVNLDKLENISLNLSEQVLDNYKKITPKVTLCNPSTFIPLIESSINIYKSKMKEQILVIITDSDLINYQMELNKLHESSEYPISIICIGVGDCDFSVLEELPNKVTNFYFVNYTKISQTENDGKKSYKIFELLPEIFAQQKKNLIKKNDSKLINLSVIKPIPHYYS